MKRKDELAKKLDFNLDEAAELLSLETLDSMALNQIKGGVGENAPMGWKVFCKNNCQSYNVCPISPTIAPTIAPTVAPTVAPIKNCDISIIG